MSLFDNEIHDYFNHDSVSIKLIFLVIELNYFIYINVKLIF